ncbi:MAG: glycosyltransferase family 4 protein [Flavobacterium sp.]
MEIIHLVLGKANPNRMNGVNKVVYQLATKQTEFGFKAAVWGVTKDTEKNYGDRNFETRLFVKSLNPFAVSSELIGALKEKKGKAIFHIHGGWIPLFYSISKFLFKENIPFVFTPHGAYNTIAMERNFWVKKKYFQLFEKSILLKSNKIHCIGKSEVTGLNELLKTNKTVLIPYGFENNSEIAIEKSTNEKIVFGFIGRLDIYTKGLDTLIRAFEKFIPKHQGAELWIIGDSNERDALQKLINDKSLQDKITLFGGKFGNEKDDLLKKIDVFVHPSRNEGLPTSVIEAASYGKPCIVTLATNIGELVNESKAGIMIHKQSETELEIALEDMLELWKNQDSFLKTRKNAIKMVNENFNWKIIVALFNSKLYH